MVHNNICPLVIDVNSPVKEYNVIYTNGIKKTVTAHDIYEAWNMAYREPYEVLDVTQRREIK